MKTVLSFWRKISSGAKYFCWAAKSSFLKKRRFGYTASGLQSESITVINLVARNLANVDPRSRRRVAICSSGPRRTVVGRWWTMTTTVQVVWPWRPPDCEHGLLGWSCLPTAIMLNSFWLIERQPPEMMNVCVCVCVRVWQQKQIASGCCYFLLSRTGLDFFYLQLCSPQVVDCHFEWWMLFFIFDENCGSALLIDEHICHLFITCCCVIISVPQLFSFE